MSKTTKPDANPRSEGSTTRLQALADGIFAVAMTLLALSLPDGAGTGNSAAAVLRGGLPHLLLYFISMLALGTLWFGHRNAFEYVRRSDHPYTWLTLAMLAFIPLVPWTVSVLARHLTDPLAMTAYNLNLTFVTGLDAATWWYATGSAGLAGHLPVRLIRVSRALAIVPPAGFLVATGVSWLSTWAALALDIALPLLPVTGLSYRAQYRLSRPDGRSSGGPVTGGTGGRSGGDRDRRPGA
jgi:uncharacterized membrane protein